MRTLVLPLALLSIVTLQAKAAHADDAPTPPAGDASQPAPPADPATDPNKPAEPPATPPAPPVEAPKPVPVATEPAAPPAAPPRMQESDDLNPNKLLTVGFGAAATVLALGAFSYEIEANASLTTANRAEDDTMRASLRKDASHQHKVAGAMAGGAVLSIGGAVFMYLRYRDEKAAESAKVSWAPAVSSDGAGFVVGGRF